MLADKKIWWDGYNNEGVILFEEFSGQVPYSTIKELCDGRDLRTEVKGGSVIIRPHTIIFCTNNPVHSWWVGVDLDPLHRRILEGGGCFASWTRHGTYIWRKGPGDPAPPVYRPDDIRPDTHVWQPYPDPVLNQDLPLNGMFLSPAGLG